MIVKVHRFYFGRRHLVTEKNGRDVLCMLGASRVQQHEEVRQTQGNSKCLAEATRLVTANVNYKLHVLVV